MRQEHQKHGGDENPLPHAGEKGVSFVFFPIVIAFMLSIVGHYLGEDANVGLAELEFELPENYDNMSFTEREIWLAEQHGGHGWIEGFGFNPRIMCYFGDNTVLFSDGYEMTCEQFYDFREGNWNEPLTL